MAIFLRTIRDRWKMLLAVTVIGLGTLVMYTSLFPTYQKILAQNQQIFSQMPEALRKAFNMDSFSFDTLEKFLNIEMYSLFWPILSIILVLSLAGSSLAGEVERETATLTAGQPTSRTAYYGAKYFAAVAMVTVFNVVINCTSIPLAAAFKLPITVSHFVYAAMMCELFSLALLGLGFGVASWLSDKGRSHTILGGIIMVMYVMNIVAGIQPKIEKIQYVSFFHYFNPDKFLVHGVIDVTALWVFAGVAIVGTIVGWWRWTKRDLV